MVAREQKRRHFCVAISPAPFVNCKSEEVVSPHDDADDDEDIGG